MKGYSNLILLIGTVLCSLYLSEYLLGRFIVKSLADHYLPPNAVQTHVMPDFSTTYVYNNYALRSDDFELGRPYDVMLLGDSFLFGQGVDIDQTVYSHLKHDAALSVMNVSEIVTEPRTYFHKLKILDAIGFKARHYVVGIFFGNDFSNIEKKNIDHLLSYHYDSNALEYNFMAFLRLERLSYLVYTVYRDYRNQFHVHKFERKKPFRKNWIEWYTGNHKQRSELMFNSKQVKRSEAEYLYLAQINGRSVDKTATIVNAMRTAVPNNSHFHVLLIPDNHYAKGELSARYETLKDLFVSLLTPEIDVIDLHGVLSKAMYFPNDGHWNTLGHRVVAERLITRLFGDGRHTGTVH